MNRVWQRVRSGLLEYLEDKKNDPVHFSLYAKLNRGLKLYNASRHSRLTQFIADGKPLPLVQAYAGHSDPRITERYVHLAADKLKQLFDEEPGSKITPLPRPKNRE